MVCVADRSVFGKKKFKKPVKDTISKRNTIEKHTRAGKHNVREKITCGGGGGGDGGMRIKANETRGYGSRAGPVLTVGRATSHYTDGLLRVSAAPRRAGGTRNTHTRTARRQPAAAAPTTAVWTDGGGKTRRRPRRRYND